MPLILILAPAFSSPSPFAFAHSSVVIYLAALGRLVLLIHITNLSFDSAPTDYEQ